MELPKGAIAIDRGPHDAVIILDGTYAATIPKRLADEIERLRADNERLMRCCGKDDMRAEIKRLRDAIAHASEYLAQDASVPTVVNTIAQRLLAGESPEIVYGE